MRKHALSWVCLVLCLLLGPTYATFAEDTATVRWAVEIPGLPPNEPQFARTETEYGGITPPAALVETTDGPVAVVRAPGYIAGVDYRSGDILWEITAHKDSSVLDGPTLAAGMYPPVADPNRAMVYTCGINGYLRAIDAEQWRLLSNANLPSRQACLGPVAFAQARFEDFGPGDLVYALFRPGVLAAFEAPGLARLWTLELVDLGDALPVEPPPAIAVSPYQEAFIALDGIVYAVSPYGTLLWQTPVPDAHQVSWTPGRDLLLVIGGNHVTLLDPRDGSTVREISLASHLNCRTPPAFLATAADDGPVALLGCGEARGISMEVPYQLAVNLSTGQTLWEFEATVVFNTFAYATQYCYPPIALPDDQTACFPRNGRLTCVDLAGQTTHEVPYKTVNFSSPLTLVTNADAPPSVLGYIKPSEYEELYGFARVDLDFVTSGAQHDAGAAPNALQNAHHTGQPSGGPFDPAAPLAGQVLTFNAYAQPIPLADAAVRVFPEGASEPVAAAVTDQNGRFWIARLQPGTYTVAVSMEGYAEQDQTVTLASATPKELAFTGVAPEYPKLRVITLGPDGQRLPGVTVTLVAHGTPGFQPSDTTRDPIGELTFQVPPDTYDVVVSLDGYATQTVQDVTLPAGGTLELTFTLQPAPARLTVTVLDAVTGQAIQGALVDLSDADSGTTDAQGRVVFEGLSAGTYALTVSAPGYDTEGPVSVTLANGDDAAQVVRLYETVQPASLQGVVTRSDTQAPVPGATVRLLQGDETVASAVTDAQGAYAFTDLAPGTYTLTAQADGFTAPDAALSVTLQPGAAVRQNATLLPATAAASALAGTVRDGAGVPLANAYVAVRTPQGDWVAQGYTDDQGAFRFEGLPAGAYEVLVQPDPATAPTTLSVSLDEDSPSDLQVQPQTTEPAPRQGVISGTVRDTDGRPVAGAKVVPVMEPDVQDAPVIAPATTGPDGRFRFENLLPWNYALYASAEGYEQPDVPKVLLSPVEEAPSAEVIVTIQKKAAAAADAPSGGGGGGGGCFVRTLSF